MDIAIVTGGSQGFGLALSAALAQRGWTVVTDARHGERLDAAVGGLGATAGRVLAVAGDVTDDAHRRRLVDSAAAAGGLSLLVHNASALGPSPLPPLARHPVPELAELFAVNVVAPVALTQLALPLLRRGAQPAVVMVSSDAAVEAYPGWGAYGATKAALDRVAAVLAVEEPGLRVYAFDPGDMRTAMHQRAFPGEDISDRAEPATVVPGLLRLLETAAPSGRYRAADVLAGRAA